MSRTDWLLVTVIVVFGCIMLVELTKVPLSPHGSWVSANTVRFDYMDVVSSAYPYQGRHGLLLLDKRNGNVWFIANGNDLSGNFKDPVFVTRLSLENLDQAH